MPKALIVVAAVQALAFLLVLLVNPVIARFSVQPPAVANIVSNPVIPPRDAVDVPAESVAYVGWARKISRDGGLGAIKARDDLAVSLLQAINADRAKRKMPALMSDARLAEAALAHAVDMAANEYLDGLAPNLWRVGERVSAVDRTLVADLGEALARREKEALSSDVASHLLDRVMAAAESREVLHSPKARLAGVGVAETRYDFLVSVVAAAPAARLAPPLPVSAVPGQALSLSADPQSGWSAPRACSFRDLVRVEDGDEMPLADCAAPTAEGLHRLYLHWEKGMPPVPGPLIEVR